MKNKKNISRSKVTPENNQLNYMLTLRMHYICIESYIWSSYDESGQGSGRVILPLSIHANMPLKLHKIGKYYFCL